MDDPKIVDAHPTALRALFLDAFRDARLDHDAIADIAAQPDQVAEHVQDSPEPAHHA